MKNIQENYRRLLEGYEVASQHYQETDSTGLLKRSLEALRTFEKAVIEVFSIELLMELQIELGESGLAIV